MDDDNKFVVGDTVYRPRWDKVDAGTIIRIERCRLDSQGRIYSIGNTDGDYVLYTAKFFNDYESQTYEWKFFRDKHKAYAELAKLIDGQLFRLRLSIKTWEAAKAAALEKSRESA